MSTPAGSRPDHSFNPNGIASPLRFTYFIAPRDTKQEDGPGETFVEEHVIESYAELADDKSVVSISKPTELTRIIAAMRHANTSEDLLLRAEIDGSGYGGPRASDFDPAGLEQALDYLGCPN